MLQKHCVPPNARLPSFQTGWCVSTQQVDRANAMPQLRAAEADAAAASNVHACSAHLESEAKQIAGAQHHAQRLEQLDRDVERERLAEEAREAIDG